MILFIHRDTGRFSEQELPSSLYVKADTIDGRKIALPLRWMLVLSPVTAYFSMQDFLYIPVFTMLFGSVRIAEKRVGMDAEIQT